MIFEEAVIIDNKMISNNSATYIIAEAGVNHNGDISIAKKLIDVAVDAGADAVKFQMFHSEELILKGISKAPYQKKTTEKNQSQYDMLKSLEMESDVYRELIEYSQKRGITFLCTPFEEKSLEILESMGVSAYKIAATDLTNIQFLRKVAQKGKPIILSAGMCYLEEIQKALEAIYPINKKLVLLQCTANYPLDDNEVNLNVIDTFKKTFNILVGYSDHSRGIGASPYAVAKGAKVIEKHFTLDRNMPGPDHLASVEPRELKELVAEVHKLEKYLGTWIKQPTLSEQYTRKSLQKCFVAKTEIRTGEPFTDENIVAKRTNGVGVSALYFDELLNRHADRDYNADDIIEV